MAVICIQFKNYIIQSYRFKFLIIFFFFNINQHSNKYAHTDYIYLTLNTHLFKHYHNDIASSKLF